MPITISEIRLELSDKDENTCNDFAVETLSYIQDLKDIIASNQE